MIDLFMIDRIYGWIDGWIDRIYGWMDGSWINRCMDKWMNHGLIDAWINGWIYRSIPIDE